MITEYYWQNTDIRKKIFIITWQFVFSPPHPHQPWHPWTTSVYTVFPQSHGFLDLWSFWIPSLRTNWSKCFLNATFQMGQSIPAEEREAWGIYTPHLQGSDWTAGVVFVICTMVQHCWLKCSSGCAEVLWTPACRILSLSSAAAATVPTCAVLVLIKMFSHLFSSFL